MVPILISIHFSNNNSAFNNLQVISLIYKHCVGICAKSICLHLETRETSTFTKIALAFPVTIEFFTSYFVNTYT